LIQGQSHKNSLVWTQENFKVGISTLKTSYKKGENTTLVAYTDVAEDIDDRKNMSGFVHRLPRSN